MNNFPHMIKSKKMKMKSNKLKMLYKIANAMKYKSQKNRLLQQSIKRLMNKWRLKHIEIERLMTATQILLIGVKHLKTTR
jgi:hypothetical protein